MPAVRVHASSTQRVNVDDRTVQLHTHHLAGVQEQNFVRRNVGHAGVGVVLVILVVPPQAELVVKDTQAANVLGVGQRAKVERAERFLNRVTVNQQLALIVNVLVPAERLPGGLAENQVGRRPARPSGSGRSPGHLRP